MSTMEKLFMQIFEKKNQIVEQVRHQTLLFDQQLASNCLLDGIAPPPWLWFPSCPSAPSAPTELNKELISELLLPCLSSIPYTEVRNSNKAFDAGDRSSVSPQLPNDVGGASDGIEKPDSSSASSPQDHRNVTVSDFNSEPFQSLAKIQRSKSRQWALELRDSAKAAKSCLYVENDICAYSCLLNRSGTAEVYNESCEVEEAKIFDFQSKENGTTNYTGRITRSRISSLQPSSLRESSRMGDPTSVGRSSRGDICAYSCLLNRSGISTPQSGQVHESGLVKHAEVYNESCEEEEAKICDFQSKEKGTTNYTGRITRSRISRLQPSSLRESSRMGDPTSVGRSSRGDTCAYSCLLNRSGISTPQSGQVHESGLVKSAEVYIESCEVEEAKICDFQSKENGTTNYTGRITRSRISSLQPSSLRESSRMGDPTSVGSSSRGDICAYSCLLNRSGISTLQSGQVHESRLVKPAEVYNESCEVEEAKICDFQSKDKGNNNYTGRITRSRISSLQPSSLRESPHMGDPTSVGRSSRGGKNVDCSKSSRELVEEDLSCLRSFGSVGVGSCPQQVGGQIIDAVSASPRLKEGDAVQSNVGGSLIDEMDHVEQPMTEESKPSSVRISHLLLEHVDELETVKPVDIDCESSLVEDAKVHDVDSREKGSNLHFGRITRSGHSKASPVRITSPVDEMNHVEQPTHVRISHPLPEHVGELEIVKAVDIYYESGMVEDAKVDDADSREKGNKKDSGRITSSGSSKVSPVRNVSPVDEMNHLEQPMIGGSKPSVKISHTLLEHDDELETVKPVDIYYESSMVEDAKVDDLHSRENGSNLYSGRITRSGSSKLSPVRITSQVDEMNHVEQPMTGGSKSSPVKISSPLQETVDELESLKPVDICYGNCVVEEAKVSDLPSREEGNNFYSGRITRSQSSSQQVSSMWESLDVENSFSNEKNLGSSILALQIGKKFIWSGKKLFSGEDGSSPGLKRRRIESQLNYSLSASPNLRDETVAQSNVIRSPVAANDPNGGCHKIQGSQSPPNLLDDKGELSLEERDRSASTPTFSYKESEMPLIPSLVHQATGDSKVFSDVEAGEADPTSFIYDSSWQGTKRENEVPLHLDDNFEKGNPEHLTRTARDLKDRISCPDENGKISYCSLGSPNRQSMELICADQAIPEFEGFIMQTDSEQSHVAGEDISFKLNLPKNSIECAGLLEQLCKSACIHTPLSQFSSTFKFHGEPNTYQSVPNGLLECIDMESNLEVNNDVFKQFNSCYSYFNKGVNQEMSHSDCLPLSNTQSSWDIKKPFTSPVRKLRDRNTSSPGSSEKRGSLNPEFFCISEENEYTEEVVAVVQEDLVKEMMPPSVKREPLADVTENPNLPASAFEAEIFAARNSLESVNTEYNFTGTCNGVTQKLGHHNSSKRAQTNKAKVSNSISIEKYGMNRTSESVQGRFSKPQVSGKPGLRKESLSLDGREAKRSNVVSNVSSFVPLVKQKQAAAIATGKKHNPVKALEAAELAKGLAQEKENKRNTEKEARKAERTRMEQMELRKKIKEEESKKKEADMAVRKRQREEEKKDKEPKRKRGMELWKQQQRDNREKLRTKKEKDLKCQPVDERPEDMKASRNGAGKDNKKETEMGGENLGKLSRTEPKTTMISTSDSIKASIVLEACEASTEYGDNSKAKGNLEKVRVDNIFTNTYPEESYDISPYKESDDENEDEDDDDIPNSKFIPSWASKKCLALAVSSQQRLNPEVMFIPESFCSISKDFKRPFVRSLREQKMQYTSVVLKIIFETREKAWLAPCDTNVPHGVIAMEDAPYIFCTK